MKEKVKEFLDKNVINETYKKYIMTILIISLFTILICITMKNVNNNIFKLYVLGVLMSIGSFTIETFVNGFNKNEKAIGTFAKKFGKKANTIIMLVAEVANIALSMIMSNFISDDSNLSFTERIAICYGIILFLISIYHIIKQNKIELSEYMLKVLSSAFKSLVIYGILAIGILVIIEILNVLFINGNYEYALIRLEILLAGFYLAPQMINAFTNINNKVGKFGKNLVQYVLMPIIIAIFIIVYVYMIKIIIFRIIPKNQVFMILSVLFVVGMIIWTSMQYIKDNRIMYKISMKLPYFYIPFIFLQAYCMTLRVIQRGFTPTRYLGYALIVFEIIYILLFIFKEKKIHDIIIAGEVIIIVSILIPKINMFDVSYFSQRKILEEYKTSASHTSEEEQKAKGAYYYLNGTKKGREYIKNNIDDYDKSEFKTKDSMYESYRKNYSYSTKNSTIDVAGYNTLTQVKVEYNDYDHTKDIDEAFSNIELENTQGKVILSNLDISNEMNELINNYDKITHDDKTFEININENKKIIINFIDLDMENDKVESYLIEGYLLEKQN